MVDESKYSGNLEPLTICMFNVEDLFCTVRLEAVNFGHLALVFMVAYALFASRKKMFVFLLVFFFPSSCAAFDDIKLRKSSLIDLFDLFFVEIPPHLPSFVEIPPHYVLHYSIYISFLLISGHHITSHLISSLPC